MGHSGALYISFSGYFGKFCGGLKFNPEFLVLRGTRGQQAMDCGLAGCFCKQSDIGEQPCHSFTYYGCFCTIVTELSSLERPDGHKV